MSFRCALLKFMPFAFFSPSSYKHPYQASKKKPCLYFTIILLSGGILKKKAHSYIYLPALVAWSSISHGPRFFYAKRRKDRLFYIWSGNIYFITTFKCRPSISKFGSEMRLFFRGCSETVKVP